MGGSKGGKVTFPPLSSVLGVAAAALVAFEGEVDQAIDELGIAQACLLPQLRVHRDRGEAGHRVDLVAEEATPVFFEEEVDPGQALTAQQVRDTFAKYYNKDSAIVVVVKPSGRGDAGENDKAGGE